MKAKLDFNDYNQSLYAINVLIHNYDLLIEKSKNKFEVEDAKRQIQLFIPIAKKLNMIMVEALMDTHKIS